MKRSTRAWVFVGSIVTGVTSLVGQAMATTATFNMSGATSGITAQVTQVLPAALVIGSAIIGLFLAWKIVKRFAR